MAFDEALGERVAAALQRSRVDFQEKRMFGGLGFMINDKMCVGIVKDDLMVRVLDEKYADVLKLPHAREMDFTGRPMKGFLYVSASGLHDDDSLQKWMDLGIEFAKFGKVKTKRAGKK
jgi:TfoX/Sxy family transcriptional regulator of competence genes